MKKILVFAGTYEGRALCEFLSKKNISATACVATEYGEEMLSATPRINVIRGRLGEAEMAALIQNDGFDAVFDATHPFAKEVTINIKAACLTSNTTYIRLIREEKQYEGVIKAKDIKDAVEILKETEGNVLVATGSKELHLFRELTDYDKRLYVRVLPSCDSVGKCAELGFGGKNIIAMQGPFSKEMNAALIKQLDCRYVVTKSDGNAGGLDDKIEAANETGARVILIERPDEETGCTLREAFDLIDGVKARNEYFPLFVPSGGKRALVAGGGAVAERRIGTLHKFRFGVVCVSPEITPKIKNYIENNEIEYRQRNFTDADLEDCFLVVAATDDRAVNSRIGQLAKQKGLYVSVADRPDECNYFFPAIIARNGVVAGVTSGGMSHAAVKEAAAKIREALK